MVKHGERLARYVGVACIAATLTAFCTCSPEFVDPIVKPRASIFYVSPSGSDANDGLTGPLAFKTIQRALDVAGPGDAVELGAGDYFENARSRRDGVVSAPIVVRGPRSAVMHGSRPTEGGNRAFEINHDHIHLEGFTLDGFSGGDASDKKNYKDKLLYVLGRGVLDGVQGFKALRLRVQNAGGECIRLRYFARQNEIAFCEIMKCGLFDFRFSQGGSNGEGIYLGTAPSDVADGKNPTDDPDSSSFNHIHDNMIDTEANECVDAQEAADDNVIERNICRGQRQEEAAGISVRGSRNLVSGNQISGSQGYGLRIGGGESDRGTNNTARANELTGNGRGGIRVTSDPQGLLCGNIFKDNGGPNLKAAGAAIADPAAPCP